MRPGLSLMRATMLGLFVLVGLALFLLGIFAIGREGWHFRQTFHLTVQFPKIGGIIEGTRVRVQGINAGMVDEIRPPTEPGGPVVVIIRLDQDLANLIRTDASANLVTQGVVGAKVVEIDPGSSEAPVIAPGATIPGRAIDVSDVLDQVNELVVRVQHGEGSLGKFIVDEDAHDQVMRLLTQGETTLRTLDEDLKAVRTVWPLNTYFARLGLHDAAQLLFRPDAQEHRRILASSEIFEPGRAVLLPQGRERLRDVGEWLKGFPQRNAEIVIAAFTSLEESDEKARILTQNQAEAVRDYLVQNFSIDGTGFLGLRSRKVTAAGLGHQDLPPADGNPLPKDRIEVKVFLPL
jgi:phospholipid/cholesterol/gamma-HCH transport system substrate-binding protein